MSSRPITRHRLLALGGAAVIAVPLAVAAFSARDTASAATTDPSGRLHSYADIVAVDKPATVTIITKSRLQETAADPQQFGDGGPYDDFFRQFFGQDDPFGQPQQRQKQPQIQEALGSGFILASDGVIVTNNHVVDGATDIRVVLDDGKDYKAKLLGHDSKTDLAVLKIDAGHALPVVAWGDSDGLRVGDPVLAIGNPFGIGTTVTSGIVSARGRDLHDGPYDDFIQVDAAINHGNSGGPLVDADGHVVGINTAIYSPNGGNVGVGFAIPSNEAQAVVAKLETGKSIQHGYIGVSIQPVTQDVADALGVKDDKGALIAEVVQGSPAAKAGLKSGDVVTSVNGRPVATPKDLSRFVADLAPGEQAGLSVLRHGKSLDISLTVGRNASDKA
jgi:serine protease Do